MVRGSNKNLWSEGGALGKGEMLGLHDLRYPCSAGSQALNHAKGIVESSVTLLGMVTLVNL